MVPASGGVRSLPDLAGRPICVVGGSTNESVMSDRMRQLGLAFQPLRFQDADQAFYAYQRGRCSAITSDRTGLAAALVLSALGVSQADIVQDYVLTNALYRHPPGATTLFSPEVMAVLWRVREDFLHAAFGAVNADHGSMARYLEVRLGLDPNALERLRHLYLS